MKYYLILSILIYPSIHLAQFIDSFDDNDLNHNPEWSGETNKFIIDNGVLRLSDIDFSGRAYLSIYSLSINDALWEWDFQLDFNPSSSNYMDVYLAADHSHPDSVSMGYFIRIGSTRDEISLYYRQGHSYEKIIDGIDDRVDKSTVTGKVIVSRDANGLWTLGSILDGELAAYYEPPVHDNRYSSSSFFIIECNYTSTRWNRFYIDNIQAEGTPYRDMVPPSIQSFIVRDSNHLWVSFNEEVLNPEEPSHYLLLPNEIKPATVIPDSSGYELVFLQAFRAGKLSELHISEIEDLSLNALDTLLYFRHFENVPLKSGDIVINEIMSDPDPSVGLAEVEYVELFNTLSHAVDLSDHSFGDKSLSVELKGVWIDSMDFIVLRPAESEQAAQEGIFTFSEWPTLNNSTDEIFISDLDTILYYGNWQDSDKSEGGWALERADPDNTCQDKNNWYSSIDASGGTPGSLNSIYGIYIDRSPPKVMDLYYDSLINGLLVEFNERVFLDDHLSFDSKIEIEKVYFNNSNSIVLEFDTKPESRTLYELVITGIKDCSGNTIVEESLEWVITEIPVLGDISINELMFQPDDMGAEYIEIYNLSQKYISLSSLRFSSETVIYDSIDVQNTSHTILRPGEYMTLSRSINTLRSRHPQIPEQNMASHEIPHLSNHGQSLLLQSKWGLIDSIYYSPEFHFELLVETRGVSLERIEPGLASVRSNWASASSLMGYSTPGRVNSHYVQSTYSESSIEIDPPVIVPDNSGFRDLAFIRFDLGSGTWSIACTIFSLDGRHIKELANNELHSGQSVLTWDGITEDGRRASMGLYLAIIQAFNEKGEVRKLSGTVAVTYNK